ncbi:MAG TPA: dockerin [Polyangiaceae bacterium]|nr:dockerin [Polyangiaceae bacterium]
MGWRPLTALSSLLLACHGGSDAGQRLAATVIAPDTGLQQSWDLNGIIGTGQSLAVGAMGLPLRATAPSFNNLKLDLGTRFFPAADPESRLLSLVALREPIRRTVLRYPAPYPGNIVGETPHTCMASEITRLLLDTTGGRGDYVTVHSVVGESGQALSVIGKNPPPQADATGVAYERSLFETRAITRLAKAAKRSFGVAAIVLTHGESDAENLDYERGVLSLWQDYNQDLPKITGQTKPVPLLLTQQSSCPLNAGSLAYSALAALRASRAPDSGIVCVGPRYQYSYADDGVHLDSLGYDRLGEKYGQAYFESVVRGRPWRPLSPSGARRDGEVIRVDFHVPVPPLVWDGALPAAATRSEWALGRGFELSSNGLPLTITGVEIASHSVALHMQSAPHGAVLVRYAATAAPTVRAHGTRRWGQLRDSDPFIGTTTRTAQPNYAVTFELEVP